MAAGPVRGGDAGLDEGADGGGPVGAGLSTWGRPLPTWARISGVLSQVVSRASMRAPRSSSSRTTSALPEPAAACSGVAPSWPRASSGKLASSMSRTAPAWRLVSPRPGLRRVTCRSSSTRPWGLPLLMASSTVVPARSYWCWQPPSPAEPAVVKRFAGQGGGVFAGVILAVGEQVEPGVDDVGEQVGDQPPRSKHNVTFRSWPAMPRGWGSRPRIWLAGEDDGWAHHDQQRVPGTVGDSGFLGARGGELEPGYVHLLHVPGAEVRPPLACPSM